MPVGKVLATTRGGKRIVAAATKDGVRVNSLQAGEAGIVVLDPGTTVIEAGACELAIVGAYAARMPAS